MGEKGTTVDDIKATLERMRAEYWQALGESRDETSDARRDVLVVRLGGEWFGIACGSAREVLRLPRLVRVPRVEAHIAGIVNLRGQVLAVTDLRPLLGLPQAECGKSGRLVVVEAAGMTTALLAEEVLAIRTLDPASIEPVSGALGRLPAEVLTGQVPQPEGLLVLLDCAKILQRPELVVDHEGR